MEHILNYINLLKGIPLEGWILIIVVLFIFSFREGQRNYKRSKWMSDNKDKGVYKLVYLKKKKKKRW